MRRPNNEGLLISGLVACPEDGKIHRWNDKLGRTTNGSHSFGAAAVRNEASGDVEVTMYADVYGKRTGEAEYPAQFWDDEFIRSLIDSKRDMQSAYDAFDRLVMAFGHQSLKTMVTFDESKPFEEQVTITQEVKGGRPRMITDSIKSVGAFVLAAEQGLYYSENLLEATEFVPATEYHGRP